jgi:hypothetical protein
MSELNKLHFASSMFLQAWDFDDDFRHALEACGGQGDQGANVEHVINNFDITGEVDECVTMLEMYGAWSDEELQDHDANLRRLVWISGCDLCESDELYFE